MSMEHQVAALYGVTKGYVDAVPVENVKEWENGLHAHLDVNFEKLMTQLREKKALEPEIEDGLKKALEDWNQTFPTHDARRTMS